MILMEIKNSLELTIKHVGDLPMASQPIGDTDQIVPVSVYFSPMAVCHDAQAKWHCGLSGFFFGASNPDAEKFCVWHFVERHLSADAEHRLIPFERSGDETKDG